MHADQKAIMGGSPNSHKETCWPPIVANCIFPTLGDTIAGYQTAENYAVMKNFKEFVSQGGAPPENIEMER